MSDGAPVELLTETRDRPPPERAPHTSVSGVLRQAADGFRRPGSQELGARIADKFGIALGEVELKTFSNGEVYCRYLESIRGADVFIVQSTHAPVNRNLMELLLMIDAAKGASAHRIIAVTPWFGYSRQDKKSAPREPISARLVAHMLETAGRRPRPDDAPARGPGAGLLPGPGRPPDRAPDADPVLPRQVGSGGRTSPSRPTPGAPSWPRSSPASWGAARVHDQEPPGAQHRRGGLRRRRRRGQGGDPGRRHDRHRRHARARPRASCASRARRVCSPPRPTASSPARLRAACRTGFEEIVVTDTIPLPADAPDKIRVLSVADILARSIRSIFTDGSVSELFAGENQLSSQPGWRSAHPVTLSGDGPARCRREHLADRISLHGQLRLD